MESFNVKPESELEKQVQQTEEILNYGPEDPTSLLPDGEAVFSMSQEELSKKYTRRYLTYVELLRKVRSGESVDEAEFEKEYQIIKALNNLKEYVQTHKDGGTEKFMLRERQIETLQKISDWLEAGGTKGHIVMPTGCGKTVIFLALVEAMGLKTFICEPTQIIQDQVIIEVQEKTEMEDVAKRNTQKRDISKQVVVTTYQSLLNDVKNARLGENELDLVIRDEAHKSLGENTSTALDLVGGIQIGFTATEDYEYKSVADQLPDCIDKLDPIEAIRLKMISGYKNWVVGTDISLEGIKLDGSKEDNALLEKAVDITKRNMVAVDIYKNAFQANNSQGVCFCSGITHSENVAGLFNSQGIIARHIDGDTPINERKKILAAYKKGEISILTCSDVLIEGFDEKQVGVIFNLAPSQSKVRVMQRGGRALRQDEDRNIPKVAHIFDFEDKDSKAIPYGYYLGTEDTATLALEDEQRFSDKEEKARKDYESVREQIMNISKGLQTALEGTANVIYDKDLYNEYLGRVDERFEKNEITVTTTELKKLCEEYKIESFTQYVTFVKDPVNTDLTKEWPISLYTFLKRRGLTIAKFFERESPKEITISLEYLRKFCEKNNIKNSKDYERYYYDPANKENTTILPSKINRFLKRNNLTISEFFGTEAKIPIIITIETLQKACSDMGINTLSGYKEFVRDPKNEEVVKGWPKALDGFVQRNNSTISEFFNKEVGVTVKAADLKDLCLQHGIKSAREYKDFVRDPKNKETVKGWPKAISIFFYRHNTSAIDFFNKDKIDIEIKILKDQCNSLNIKSGSEYTDFVRDPKNKETVKGWPKDIKNFLKINGYSSKEFFDR